MARAEIYFATRKTAKAHVYITKGNIPKEKVPTKKAPKPRTSMEKRFPSGMSYSY